MAKLWDVKYICKFYMKSKRAWGPTEEESLQYLDEHFLKQQLNEGDEIELEWDQCEAIIDGKQRRRGKNKKSWIKTMAKKTEKMTIKDAAEVEVKYSCRVCDEIVIGLGDNFCPCCGTPLSWETKENGVFVIQGLEILRKKTKP